MKPGILISILVAAAGIVGLGMIFVQGASPYVTVAIAKANPETVHVVGEMVPGTMEQDPRARIVRFMLKDATGTMPVEYHGAPQANLASATKVVVIGAMKGDRFTSDRMLLKCPSKYDSQTTAN